MPDLTLNDSPFASQSFANISLFDSLIQSDLEDPQLRMCGWEKLKEKADVGPLNIPMMMREVEQEVLDSGKPLVDNVNELFERFAAKLAPEFEIAQVPAAARQVTELQLSSLQERLREHYENAALETMWNACLHRQFQAQGAFAQEAPPRGHQAIRKWLNNPVNQPRIQQITQFGQDGFGLKRLGLRVLPTEIGLFTGLTYLDLAYNQLVYLPDSLGNLQALRILHLYQNQLSYLPNSLGNLQALETLILDTNQLSYLPESLGNLQALDCLSLIGNRLSYLPEFLGNLQALTRLSLGGNQLSNLPEFLGNLQALRGLDLSGNQLSFLPESFGNLSALTLLDLNHNQLSCLPKSFGNLRTIECLDLDHNQLSYLPESFDNLQTIEFLGLDDNPWMLVSDKERNKIADYQTYFALLEPLKKYTPQSPLATLFHAIIFNKPAEAIQQAFAQLSPEMQHRIAVLVAQNPTYSGPDLSKAASSSSASSSSDPSLSQDNLFNDMGLFARSVRRAAFDLFESLISDQKNGVYYHVWDLAGRPETDGPQWGEHHVFDHVLRFTDALQRATQN